MQQNIKETLLEARKAYRFLYEYQSRVLDLVSFIGRRFGFKYNGGYSKFSETAPRTGWGRLELCAWNWLNLYFYEFNFEKKKTNNNEIHFSIFVVNDSGFFDARDKGDEKKAHKLDTDSFEPVEKSESKLIFVAGKNMWEGWGEGWDNPEFISKPFGKKDCKTDENKLMVFKHYSLENFENRDKAMSCIKDFEKYCLENNIDLHIKTNSFE